MTDPEFAAQSRPPSRPSTSVDSPSLTAGEVMRMLMEPQPGVFVTSLSTDAWEPDPDVGGLMHVLCDVPGLQAGFTRYDTVPAPVRWTPPQRETFMILEGAARIEIAGGATLDLEAGGVASLPAGTETTWHITVPFREFWVLSGPGIEPDVP